MGEAHAFGGELIQIPGLDDRIPICAVGFGAVVVGDERR
jgi:hypothetical protein